MRWGRILTGILIVGTATFAFAYHLPLQQAHEKLTNSFAALSLAYVLNPGKLDVSAPGKDALCSVAGASGKKAIRVLAIADKKSIPPGLASKLKTPLDYSTAVAALVAQTLIDKCSVEPSAVSATGFAAEPSASSKIEGKKLAGARVELWLETSK
jgi:hypothetical protein